MAGHRAQDGGRARRRRCAARAGRRSRGTSSRRRRRGADATKRPDWGRFDSPRLEEPHTNSTARHRGVVALARAELQDPQVATGPIGIARADLREQLVRHVLVPDERHDLALVVHAAFARLGDELLGDGPQRLGLGLGGDDRLRPRSATRRGCRTSPSGGRRRRRSGDPSSVRRASSDARARASDRPRSSRRWSTSSRDFWPKLVIASRSSGVRSTSSPIVLIWARFRQLRGRSERSRSSIGWSRSGEPEVGDADVAELEALARRRTSSATSETRPRSVWPAEASALAGRDRAVGLDVEDQPVVVGRLLDAGRLDRERDPAHRARRSRRPG